MTRHGNGIEQPLAAEELKQHLAPERSARERYLAVIGLTEIQGTPGVNVLVEVGLRDPDYRVRLRVLRALRRASYATVGGYHYSTWSGGDSLITLLILVGVGWLLWTTVPDAQLMMQQAYLGLHHLFQRLN